MSVYAEVHMDYVVHDVSEMRIVARDVLAVLSADRGARVLALAGDLGAGKTTFVKALAAELGLLETVTSPTFGLMRRYAIPPREGIAFTHLVHIDAYRLDEGDDMASLGWNDIVADSHTLVCIEWPERISDILPKDTTRLLFEHIDETTRKVSCGGKG